MKKSLAIAIASLTILGCNPSTGAQNESIPEETLNEDEAIERVEEHINEAVTALPETVELDPLHGQPIIGGCDGGGEDEDVTVSNSYGLRELPPEGNNEHAKSLLQYWNENGYEILKDRRPEKLRISVQSTEDAFRMSLRESDQGTLSIHASSPCVPKNEPR